MPVHTYVRAPGLLGRLHTHGRQKQNAELFSVRLFTCLAGEVTREGGRAWLHTG